MDVPLEKTEMVNTTALLKASVAKNTGPECKIVRYMWRNMVKQTTAKVKFNHIKYIHLIDFHSQLSSAALCARRLSIRARLRTSVAKTS